MPSQRLINYVLPVLAVFFLALAVAFVPAPVFAQALPSGPSVVFPPSVAGNAVSYGAGVATAANASSIAFPPAANGAVYATSTQSLNVGGGRAVDIVIRSRPAPAAIARAVGTFAGKMLLPIVAGKALWDLCNELGFGCSGGGGQPLVVTQSDPLVCSSAPCYQWYMIGAANRGPFSSVAQACAANAGWLMQYYSPRLVGPITGGTIGASSGCQGILDGSQTYVWSVAHDGIQVPPQPSSAPATLQQLQDAIAAKSGWPDSSAITRVLPEAIASGVPLELPTPYQVTGPASVPLAPSITAFPDGSSVTDQRSKNLSYGPNSVTVTETSTKTQTSPTGAVSPISTSTSGDPLPSQPATTTPDIEVCGLPGGPACKIDETGTPEPLPVGKYTPAAEEYKTKADENRTTIGGNGDKPFFTGWNVFFFAPPLAACQPLQLPDFNGAPMGSLDACNVVDGTRTVMSYIWALAALFLCLGMIKREV